MVKFCSLYSGSSGNSIFISSGNTRLLIDAGLSCKKIVQALDSIDESPSSISALLITHEHSDHIRGAGILMRKLGVPLYVNEKTWYAMKKSIGKVSEDLVNIINTGEFFEIGDIIVKSFPIPHDAVDPVAYSFFIGNNKITTATDIGHVTEELYDNLKGSCTVLLESNHDVEMLMVGGYPWPLKKRILGDKGHLSNETCAGLSVELAKSGTKRFVLGHLSKENNFPDLAYQTTYNELNHNGFKIGEDVLLKVASRHEASEVINF